MITAYKAEDRSWPYQAARFGNSDTQDDLWRLIRLRLVDWANGALPTESNEPPDLASRIPPDNGVPLSIAQLCEVALKGDVES